MATEYRIYPPIGFGRLGNAANEFLIAREQLGRRESQFTAAGAEVEVTDFKVDHSHIKPVGARYRVFAIHDDGTPPAVVDTSTGASIEWTVEVANRKGGVNRNSGPPGSFSLPVNSATGGTARIEPGPKNVNGAHAGPVGLTGGSFQGTAVSLGELRTDASGNLIVVGARGISTSPTNGPLDNFYSNPTWHDDTCDGSVRARVTLANGTVVSNVAPAWFVSGPPDYAPDIEGLVTLYDIMREVQRANFGVPLPMVSFTTDIYPILRRASQLQWVSSNSYWPAVNTNWGALSDPGLPSAPLRQAARNTVLDGAAALMSFSLTTLQLQILQQFAAGNFVNDWIGPPVSAGITPEELTRVALDSTVGQGFFPGIEMGIVSQNPGIYALPFEFRLNPTAVKPGDLTALMALPWQADFLACSANWWPSQRPNEVLQGVGGPLHDWADNLFDFRDMVDNFQRLGFVVARSDGAGNTVFVEQQRDPGI